MKNTVLFLTAAVIMILLSCNNSVINNDTFVEPETNDTTEINDSVVEKNMSLIRIELGGCNNNQQKSVSASHKNDTIVCQIVNDTLIVNVGINYYCCASMQATADIFNDTILLNIKDITASSEEYCRCSCYYTFDYYFANCKDKEYVIKVLFDSQKNETEAVTIPTSNFDYRNYGCSMNITNMQHDSVYVINSEKEFANYFTCGNNPPIDFTTKTLLVAFCGTTNGIKDISTELLAENSTKYILSVDVKLIPAAVAQGWYIALIADKINTSGINLNVNKHF